MAQEIAIGSCSRSGPRPVNEDCAAALLGRGRDEARGLIAVLADGVSTGGGGGEAARMTVRSIVSDYFGTPDTWDTSVALERLIGAQNAWLTDHNRRRQAVTRDTPPKIGMTTLTVLTLRGHVWTVAHIGDTRAWLLRDGQCIQLTQDHTFTEAFQRSRLTRVLGFDDPVRIDYAQGDLRNGDVFLLTSDGVHGVLDRTRLAALVAADPDPQRACDAIVAAALKDGGTDNATALITRVDRLLAGGFEDLLVAQRDLPGLRALRTGDRLDRYTIIAPLADTGVHRLYHARADDGAEVVIKGLHDGRAGDRQERAMLAHEAWLGERLGRHPPPDGEAGFVRVIGDPVAASALYIAFERHAGATLAQLQVASDGRAITALSDIVAAAIALGKALARLHRSGVIHRDIKPDNLLRSTDGRWWILDLGAALSGSDPPELRQLRAGTASYMNPEQWGIDGGPPRPPDAASDVYALGVTLYQWLTGKLPYGEVMPFQAGRFRRDPKPPSRLRPDVPFWLDALTLRSVARDPRQRFETAEEFVLALERGAVRPLASLAPSPLAARDPTALWKIAFALSLLFNLLLVFWLLWLPR